ncbi:MAG: hypothetical protein IT184_06075 [Acidobacteria bacterium]|nr:hypothetical protein [Acidobacteriota bacterium]
MTETIIDLEAKAAAGGALTRADAERVLRSLDLIRVGVLGESARRRRAGLDVTYGRVAIVPLEGGADPSVGHAGEVRIAGRPTSLRQACERVSALAALAGGVPLTGFSAADLFDLAGGDYGGVAESAARLRAAGLEAVAECPVDRLASVATAVGVIRALRQGGLAMRRLTVDRASGADRLDVVFAADAIQRDVQGVAAFAPLPRRDPVDAPSTGYDDVRTMAVAALVCRDIRFIQADWLLYGPKLAQVSIAYGANDIDGIDPVDSPDQGPRRSAKEEIARQIRAAGGVPVERDGRYERRP